MSERGILVEQPLVFKHRDGNISFNPSRNELEIECFVAFKNENEDKKPFKGKFRINPEVMFEVYKLTKKAVENQEIENGKILYVKNGFKRTPQFTIGRPTTVSEGFVKRKGVFALLAEDDKENMSSRFIFTLGDLINLLGFLKQIPMRFRMGTVIFERRGYSFSMINPFTLNIREADVERIRIAVQQFLSKKEEITPAFIGELASFFKKGSKSATAQQFVIRLDDTDVEITEAIAKDLWIFLN